MRLLGFFLVKIGSGAASVIGVTGVTAEAELKSRIGDAAKVAHGGGISCSLLTSRFHVYAPAYSGTLPSPTGFWRFLTEF